MERDFFPYIYARAERMFMHKLVDSYLKDGIYSEIRLVQYILYLFLAIFSKDRHFREEARQRMNNQIDQFNKLLKIL